LRAWYRDQAAVPGVAVTLAEAFKVAKETFGILRA